MIRTLLTPQQQNISIVVPHSYVGKPIEVLLFALDEAIEEKVTKSNNAARFKGILTKAEANKYDTYLKETRSQWDRSL